MNSTDTGPDAATLDAHAELFADLVMQHANMALIFCGAVPHPETGKPTIDLQAAKLFIDRLEMLQVKTRGNLGPHEEALLKQSMATARMAFVESVRRETTPGSSAASPQEPASTPAEESVATAAPAGEDASGTRDVKDAKDERKKFVKKY